MGCFESGLSKSLKKDHFFFQTQSLLINKIMKKMSLNLGASHSSGYKTSSDKFLD